MDPSTIQNTISPMTPDSLKTPPQGAEKPKNHKVAIWALSILSIIATTAAGVFAYLYFTGQNTSPAPVVNNNGNTPEPVAEEVEITDTYVLRDLDEKIAILHDTSETGSTINKGTVVGGYSENIFNMYAEGNLNPLSIKVAYVIRDIESQFRYLNAEERQAISNDVQADVLEGIDGDKVAKKYRDVFGEDLVRETSEGCYTYRYNAEYDIYFKDPFGGCGGSSPYRTYFYKSKYTTTGDNAYVYVSTALSNGEDDNVYCDITSLSMPGFVLLDNAKVCASLPENGVFVLDESNYQDFAEYRFVFNKANDDTYYFEKVEKL